METEGSFQCLQKPTTRPYPKPVESSPHIFTPILHFHYDVVLPLHPSTWRIFFSCIFLL